MALLVIFFVNSCIPQQQYQKVIYSNGFGGKATFRGLNYYLLSEVQSNQQSLVIFMFHGMSLGKPEKLEELYDSWAEEKINTILEELDVSERVESQTEPHITKGAIRVYRYEVNLENQGQIIFYEVNYAGYFVDQESYPFDARDKKELYTDNEALIESAVTINKDLKRELVVWGLADAVTYLNHKKRDVILKNISYFLKETFEANPNSKVVFITESLGSKVLFDSLMRLYNLRRKDVSPCQEKDNNILRNVQTIYMMANQLALIELGTEEPPRYSWKRLFEEDCLPENLTVVAFSDPNDLLTFPVGAIINQYSNRIRVIDIAVNNNSTSLLGIFNNPFKAHTKYFKNTKVLDLLIKGM